MQLADKTQIYTPLKSSEGGHFLSVIILSVRNKVLHGPETFCSYMKTNLKTFFLVHQSLSQFYKNILAPCLQMSARNGCNTWPWPFTWKTGYNSRSIMFLSTEEHLKNLFLSLSLSRSLEGHACFHLILVIVIHCVQVYAKELSPNSSRTKLYSAFKKCYKQYIHNTSKQDHISLVSLHWLPASFRTYFRFYWFRLKLYCWVAAFEATQCHIGCSTG